MTIFNVTGKQNCVKSIIIFYFSKGVGRTCLGALTLSFNVIYHQSYKSQQGAKHLVLAL